MKNALTELDSTWLAGCITTESGRQWFRYDTGDNTTKENWSLYCAIQETLREHGLQIEDVHIEHDCVSGHLLVLPSNF